MDVMGLEDFENLEFILERCGDERCGGLDNFVDKKQACGFR